MPVSSVPTAVTICLERLGMSGGRVVPLTPDASDRRYYRVWPSNQAPPVVLALHAAPFPPGSSVFTTVSRLFASMPLPVPEVRREMADLGILILDDLGDTTLHGLTGGRPDESHRAWYERAVDHLVTLQTRGAALVDPALLPYQLAFDVEKLMWEMDFFITHFIEEFRGRTIEPAARTALREQLRIITQELSDEPRVLCHRDYHSRNLMVTGDNLFVIDFQDARMGPDTYDLVSLLRDSYVDLPSPLVSELTARFLAATGQRDVTRFEERLDLMGVQRNLKALGTFGYQAVARANPAYAQYVPRTIAYVQRAFVRRPRFGLLHELLTPLIPEIA